MLGLDWVDGGGPPRQGAVVDVSASLAHPELPVLLRKRGVRLPTLRVRSRVCSREDRDNEWKVDFSLAVVEVGMRGRRKKYKTKRDFSVWYGVEARPSCLAVVLSSWEERDERRRQIGIVTTVSPRVLPPPILTVADLPSLFMPTSRA